MVMGVDVGGMDNTLEEISFLLKRFDILLLNCLGG